MRETGQQGHLLAIIDDLESLADADRYTLASLRDRLRACLLRVIVTGEAKRGKSTLVNALLGREGCLPGRPPYRRGHHRHPRPGEQAEIAFGDGHTEHVPLAELSDFVTERGNPGNRRDVAGVTVEVDAPILARGAELVDTPGTGSVHEHNTAAAGSALATMDAAVFVLTADPPMSASERELLARVDKPVGGPVRRSSTRRITSTTRAWPRCWSSPAGTRRGRTGERRGSTRCRPGRRSPRAADAGFASSPPTSAAIWSRAATRTQPVGARQLPAG